MSSRSLLPILLILLALAVPSGIARVFQRISAAQAVELKSAYKTQMKINGRDAMLHVDATYSSLNEVLAGLQASLDEAASYEVQRGRSMAIITVKLRNGRERRYLISELPETDRTIVMRSDSSQTPRAPRHLMKVASEYPGSTPTYHAIDKGHAMEIQTATTGDPSQLVRDYYDALLQGQGWAPVMPMQDMHGPPGVMMYQRGGGQLLCVSASRDSYARRTTITLLHNRSGVR